MNLTLGQLHTILISPAGNAQAENFIGPLNRWCAEFSINTPLRLACLLAQLMVESEEFTHTRESTMYTHADILLRVFPREFENLQQAEMYVGKPISIASRVYANRLGNGSEASQEGWLYRGGGLIQITGKANYEACGKALGLDLLAHPELIEKPDAAAGSAAWFWHAHGCNDLADKGDFRAITAHINGPAMLGLDKRLGYLSRAQHAPGIA